MVLSSFSSFFLLPRLVFFHKYICTSLREVLSLFSHLNRSTWHRLKLHSVAFKASGEHLTVSFFFVHFSFLNCSFFACRSSSEKKRYPSYELLRRFSQSNNEIVHECATCRVYASVCVCKIKRKWGGRRLKKEKEKQYILFGATYAGRGRIWQERIKRGKIKRKFSRSSEWKALSRLLLECNVKH